MCHKKENKLSIQHILISVSKVFDLGTYLVVCKQVYPHKFKQSLCYLKLSLRTKMTIYCSIDLKTQFKKPNKNRQAVALNSGMTSIFKKNS